MRPEISTTSYQFAHGVAPRGRGHWAFWIRPWRGAPDSRSDLYFTEPNQLYSAAREEAVCRAYDLFDNSGGFVEVAS